MAYKRELIAKTKNLFDIDSVSFFTKDSNGEYKSNKSIYTTDRLWIPADGTKQVIISGYVKCPVGGNYRFCIRYEDGTIDNNYIVSTGAYQYNTITSNRSKKISFIGFTYSAIRDQVYIKDVQIEYGSTATEYVPYGYLNSYKKLIKVSNVCQLLDKSKYSATQTINGVTFTNNGDGSITANGTASAVSGYKLIDYQHTLVVGHKYLISGAPIDASSNAYLQCYDDTNYQWLTDKGSGGIATFPKEIVDLSGSNMIRIRINSGYTANNLIFKPQLFDLTEMYSAGNKRITVAEFREKFPNDYYEYSPSCWITSYQKNLVTGGGVV